MTPTTSKPDRPNRTDQSRRWRKRPHELTPFWTRALSLVSLRSQPHVISDGFIVNSRSSTIRISTRTTRQQYSVSKICRRRETMRCDGPPRAPSPCARVRKKRWPCPRAKASPRPNGSVMGARGSRSKQRSNSPRRMVDSSTEEEWPSVRLVAFWLLVTNGPVCRTHYLFFSPVSVTK